MVKQQHALLFLIVLLCLAACQGPATPTLEATIAHTSTPAGLEPIATQLPTSSATASLVTTPTLLSPSTATPWPSLTPIPYITTAPFPTVTPFAFYTTKPLLLRFGALGGDGGTTSDLYRGSGTPALAIYADGQVIVSRGSWQDGFTLWTGQLPVAEICNILRTLQTTGIFEPPEMIYEFDETTEYSDGASSYLIQVNGPFNQSMSIYGPYTDYLVAEVEAGFQFLQNYEPPVALTNYMPEHLVLWVEPLTDEDASSLQAWPTELPALAELKSDPVSSHVVIAPEYIEPLMALFDLKMSSRLFREGDQAYYVILRPILPHETPNQFIGVAPQQFELPFTCDGLTVPPLSQTPTPEPLVAPEQPGMAALQGRLVFATDRDGNFEIYTMYADGTGLTRLTNYPGNDYQPAWSPDGQRIAFVSDRSGHDEVYLMNADGSAVERLTYSLSPKESPAWSPDGLAIAYVDTHNADFPENDSEIHILNLTDGSITQLTDTTYTIQDLQPVWLDSERIIYASGRYPAYRLFLRTTDRTERIPLGNGSLPALSANSQQLAFISGRSLFIAQVDELIATMGSRQPILDLVQSYSAPSWSPDGQHLLYVSEVDGNAELYVLELASGQTMRLTYTLAQEIDPDWAP